MRRLVILAASFAFLPLFAGAQGKGMSAAVARPAAVSSGAVMHVAPGSVAHASAGTHVVVRGVPVHTHPVGTPVRRLNGSHPLAQDQDVSTDFYPVPGLGFDVTHVAATRGPGAVGFGRHPQRGGVAAFFPLFDGGYFVTPQTVVEDEPAADAQQADNSQQDYYYDPRPRVRYHDQSDVTPSVDTAAPVRDSEQYVFVRRDGTIIFAVAYTWENGNLRYVTTEGLRRSVSMDLLDLDATKQFNEQRGLSFRLPV